MKSILSAILFAFVMIVFFNDVVALNKEKNLPTQATDLQSDSIKQKVQPIEYKSIRGQMLYENHCLTCHESQMHIRANTKVKNLAQLRHFVLIRSTELKLHWRDSERDAVTKYLNDRYYKLP